MPPTPVGANINADLSGELPQTRVSSRSKYGKCFNPHDNINSAAYGNQSRNCTAEPTSDLLGEVHESWRLRAGDSIMTTSNSNEGKTFDVEK